MISLWGPPTPFTLTTPRGSLLFNDKTSSDGFFIVSDESSIGPTVRSTEDNIPQQDGAIPHRRWLTGTTATVRVELWVDDTDPACAADRQTMHDLLMGHLRSLIRAGDNEGRLLWTPAGQSRRMLDDIRLREYPTTTSPGVGIVEFTVDTAYPYAIDLTQTVQTVNATTANVTNGGNAEFWPVLQVNGPAANFVIRNNSVIDSNGDALSVEYDSGLPGAVAIPGGSYAEIDMFRGTIYMNGDGANLKPGIDMTLSDLFQLLPGANSITSDADCDFLTNPAWS